MRKLPSISITVTSSASPRPSDSTMLGVSAPGRWMLAIARRAIGERGRGTRRATVISSDGDQPEQDEHAGGRHDEDGGDAAIEGEFDCDQRERRHHQHGGDRVGPARPLLDARDGVAKQRRDRHVVGAPQRPQRKGHGGQHAIEHRERQAGRIDRRRERQRQHRAKPPGDDERQRRSENESRHALR